MKNFFIKLKIGVSCAAVMLLTASLIVVFHIATFLRKLILGDFVPNARKHSIDHEEESIGSANAQINAIRATLESKKEPATPRSEPTFRT